MSEGFVPAINPCCGVYAVTEALEAPFSLVWSIAKVTLAKKLSWRGRTTYSERLAILNALKAVHYSVGSMVGLTLIEAAYIARPDCNYILDLSGHSLVLKNKRFIDQCGNYNPIEYRRRFHFVKHATMVEPLENINEDVLEDNLFDSLF